MRIAFATLYDSRDVNRGSGTFYHLANEIERQGHIVHRIGPFSFSPPVVTKILLAIHRRLGKRHPLFLDPYVARRTGNQVARRLKDLEYDVLLTNDMAIAGFTPTDRPIVIYTDVMITPNYQEKGLPGCRLGNLSSISLALCRRTLRRAMEEAMLCAFPAQWSAQAALAYSNDSKKIAVVPFGANVEDPGSDIAFCRSIDRINAKGRIDLLFVGKDWTRKGGDVAVKTVMELNHRGTNAQLHIVGVVPPYEIDNRQVIVHGLLDKSNQKEATKLKLLYQDCDAFILPSSSEGFVVSVLEAAAYGLPTLAYDTIGVNSAVMNGKSGVLLELGKSELSFADAVEDLLAVSNKYSSLAIGARGHFEKSVNWQASVICLMDLIDKRVLQGSSGVEL